MTLGSTGQIGLRALSTLAKVREYMLDMVDPPLLFRIVGKCISLE